MPLSACLSFLSGTNMKVITFQQLTSLSPEVWHSHQCIPPRVIILVTNFRLLLKTPGAND